MEIFGMSQGRAIRKLPDYKYVSSGKLSNGYQITDDEEFIIEISN